MNPILSRITAAICVVAVLPLLALPSGLGLSSCQRGGGWTVHAVGVIDCPLSDEGGEEARGARDCSCCPGEPEWSAKERGGEEEAPRCCLDLGELGADERRLVPRAETVVEEPVVAVEEACVGAKAGTKPRLLWKERRRPARSGDPPYGRFYCLLI